MALIVKNNYIWDFWYVYDRHNRVFDVYFLHADVRYVPNDQHHFHAMVGRCKTLDWVDFFDIQLGVMCANDSMWANSSIWTGDSLQLGGERVIFYTSRDKDGPDPMRQSIGVARESVDGTVDVLDYRIEAPTEWYMGQTDSSEDSIHCWRDPYLFGIDGQLYMLVAAKRKDYPINHRGCVALMRLVDSNNLNTWAHVCTLVSTDYAEVELPQIYRTGNGKMRVFFNAHSHDGRQHYGMTTPFIFDGALSETHLERDICAGIPEYTNYYGYRIIPEYNHVICAFNKKFGRIEIIHNVPSLDIGSIYSLKPADIKFFKER